MDNLRLRTVMATALLLIAGVWTVGARAQSKKNGGEWVRVIAFTNTPVADADIVVSDRDGRVVFEKDHVTNDRGFYAAEIHPVPRSFRVTVISDAMRLSSDVHDYDRVHGVVYVNPVTTMVSRLLDRRPELSLARAQAIVRAFLGMPKNASLGAAMRQGPQYRSPYFWESEFINRAKAYGGFDGFVESLVTQAISHPNERHLFRGNSDGGLLGADPATEVGIALAEGALNYLAGQGVGWAASAAGFLEPGVTKEDIAAVQEHLDQLQGSIDALSDQLAQSTQVILNAIDYSTYNNISFQALKLAAQVDVVEQDLNVLADGCPPATSSPAPPLSFFCKTQKALVVSELSESEIHASFEEFSSELEDTAAVNGRGMLHLFSLCTGETAAQTGHFFRYPDSVEIQDMWDYWSEVETEAANLKVELWHLQKAQDDPTGEKELLGFLGDASLSPPTNGIFQTTLKAEGSLVFPLLPESTVINTTDHVLWMTSLPGTTEYPGCQNPIASPPYGGGISTDPILKIYLYSAPSTHDGSVLLLYHSPTVDEANALIDGWQKANANNPNAYIHDVTAGRDSDPFVGVTPFLNIAPITNKCFSWGPYVWTKTETLTSYQGTSTFYMLDMQDGTYADPKSIIGTPGHTNWVFLAHELTGTEQYYWYH